MSWVWNHRISAGLISSFYESVPLPPYFLLHLGAERDPPFLKGRWLKITNKQLGSLKCSLPGLGPFYSALLPAYLTAWDWLEPGLESGPKASLLSSPCPAHPFLECLNFCELESRRFRPSRLLRRVVEPERPGTPKAVPGGPRPEPSGVIPTAIPAAAGKPSQ